jgi:hypothetical protein
VPLGQGPGCRGHLGLWEATSTSKEPIVIHELDSAEDARAFFANPQLRDAMVRGGVKGEPRIAFYE